MSQKNNGSHSLGGFCGDILFDHNATMNSDFPRLTRCFQHTALTWFPAAFMLSIYPLHIAWVVRSKLQPLPYTALLIAKYIVQLLLILITLAQCIYSFYLYLNVDFAKENSQSIVITFDFITAFFIMCICMFILLIAINNCRRKGFVTSGVIFVSLVVFAICALPEFYDSLESISKGNNGKWLAVMFCAYFVVLLVQIFLYAFADKPGQYLDAKSTGKTCPEILSSFLNQITFWWFTSMCIQGWRRPLVMDDLWQLNNEDTSEVLTGMWQKRWLPRINKFMAKKDQLSNLLDYNAGDEVVTFVDGKQKVPSAKPTKNMPSIIWCLFLTFKHLIIPATCLKTLADTLQFLNPILLEAMITFVQNKNDPIWKGYFYAACMFFVTMMYTVLLHQYFHLILKFGMNMRTVLSGSLFEKVLRLSNSAQKERGVGEIVNLMTTDVQRFQDSVFFLNMIVSNPYQIVIAIYLLWKLLGPSVLAGVCFMILLIPVNYVVSNQQRKYQVEQMKQKDDRIKLMSEILNGIKVLKLYAWEESFEAQILKIREKELVLIRKINYYNAVSTFLWTCAPVFVSVATFAVFVWTSKEGLTAQKAFGALALFNILRFPMSMLPVMTSVLVQAAVSNKRLKSFLCADELNLNMVDRDSNQHDNAVRIDKGVFNWEKRIPQIPTLNDINFNVEKGQLIAVVGKVGSGKSSLLSAILGEMEKINGYIGLKGSVAYVPQQAWILNMTLRDNILFSNFLNDKRYDEVVEACGLKIDMGILPTGDLTEIGEKGINLSGGQKQRVSLARAVYQDADIYLLDDPLSAVDAHVGKHIFENVISNRGLLKSKTRILVTHGLHYLKQMDKIFVLSDGEISESGTYDELVRKGGAFSNILVNYLRHKAAKKEEEGGSSSDEEENTVLKSETLPKTSKSFMSRQKSSTSQKSDNAEAGKRPSVKGEASKLIQEETTLTGRVKWSVYGAYFAAMGYFSLFGCIALTAVGNVFNVGSNFWLSEWSNAASAYAENNTSSNSTTNSSTFPNEYYLGIYVTLGLVQGIFVLLANVLLAFATMAASRMLHLKLIRRLFRSPLSFFDVTPLGRILNRCGKDVDVVDSALATTVRSWIMCVCSVLATVIVICIAIHYFGLVVLPLTIAYYFVLRFYISTSRQLKRLESITRSPIYSHFQESITGANSIRAYSVQKRFRIRLDTLMDINQSCYYASLGSNRWLAVRLELIGNLMVFFAALFAVLGRDQFNGGQIGLAISYALAVTQALNWAVRMTSDLETNIVSVERIKEYSEINIEAPWVTNYRPPTGWPLHGLFVFDQYRLRYRNDLDYVLKDLTFKIEGAEKIGIVGRTGAGKSSLTLALFRIVESSGGKIWLDDVDISQIGLHDLRSRLTIIPQEPVLFSSNFRFNLDPFDKYTDEEIWNALGHAHLKKFVADQPQKLLFKISEGGENLSVGQRQLVCLARALLRKTKVLILDEATAAVDLETDDLIQKTIRTYFADCTILTIAHRLNTIMDSDRIMVLSAGRIVEFESPRILLKKPSSLFYALAKDAGLV